VILADEPTGSLDSTSGLQVMELLESVCRDRGATLVLVTHAPDLALRADRIVRMLDGRALPEARGPQAAGVAPAPGEERRLRALQAGV
jgi:putative ABC transport system ATP-binding protein